tara:strand:+ start:1537 stop:1788 length:252 start_codon:yes stop_codon:yes gene_type:complete
MSKQKPKKISKKKRANNRSKSALFATYGIAKLSANLVSAIALCSISFSLNSIKKNSDNFNKCINEMNVKSIQVSSSVRYCNGG